MERADFVITEVQAMNRKRLLAAGVLCAMALAVGPLRQANGDANDEIKRVAALMEWKPGTSVADIGAGDGRWTFAAAHVVGSTGKVFATEIDREKLAKLRADVGKRKLQNVAVVESKEADTSLPAECCQAIFLRRVYHHLTQPMEFDAALVRSLKAGGRLAIIDFPPRSGLDPVEGVPANRGGDGIPRKVVIEELTPAGRQLEKNVNDWPDDE